jgi:hypothetical protein
MGIKKYIVASILLMAIVVGYVYSINQNDFTVNIPEIGFSQTLPLYIWIIVPAIVLFIATLLHMFYYGAKGYFKRTTMQKDLAKIVSAIDARLLKKESDVHFKTPELKEFNNIINQLEVSMRGKTIETSNTEIQNAVSILTKLDTQDYIPAKELKLSNENELYKKNIINRVLNDDNFAIEVLKNSANYDEATLTIAYDRALENKSVDTIKKSIETVSLTNKMVKDLLVKDSKSSKEMSFTNTEILQLIQDNKFSNDDLIEVSKNYKRTMSPEQLIKLFEDIAANDEKLTPSYLYVLFEYEMLDTAREIILNSQKDEYIIFKAMLDLRDAGKHYTLDNLKFD